VQCTSDIYRAAVAKLTIPINGNNPEFRFLVSFVWFAERTLILLLHKMIFVRAKVCFLGGSS
jgi:hypothetical protein